MSKLISVMLGVCILVAGACSTVRVSENYRGGANFTELKTYNWLPAAQRDNDRENDPLMDEHIRNVVEQELDSKGFRKETTATPNFFVDFHYAARLILEHSDIGAEMGMENEEWHSGVFGGINVPVGANAMTREEGIIILDIIDPKSGRILWRGKGTDLVDRRWKPETKIAKMTQLVKKTLAQFPPTPKPGA